MLYAYCGILILTAVGLIYRLKELRQKLWPQIYFQPPPPQSRHEFRLVSKHFTQTLTAVFENDGKFQSAAFSNRLLYVYNK